MKKKSIKIIFLSVLMVVCGLFNVSEKVMAKRAIALSPMSQRIILTPGETYSSGFSIVNPSNTDSDLEYLATIGSFSYTKDENGKDDYGNADIESISNINEIMNWTTIDNPTGIVPPNETRTLSYTVKVPKDAPAGGQYMTILVRENPAAEKPEGESSTVNETMQMGFVVYAEVTGNTRKEGSIVENSMPSFLLNNKLEATSKVRNSGNVHTDAEVTLQVWPLFSDEEICTNEEDATLTFVMPNTERYHVETCDLPMLGIFRAKQVVKIFGETSVVEKVLVACPLWLLFAILFVIIGLIIWIVIRIRSRKKAKAEIED